MSRFDASRLKVKRAKKHVFDLETCVIAFFDAKHYKIILEKNPKTCESIYKVEISGDIPVTDAALIIGDALHNLKSALDIAYLEFVRTLGGNENKWTSFPVRDSRDKLVTDMTKGAIQAFPLAQQFIVDTIKPYPGGNDTLCALHELNIADKHKLLIPIVVLTELRNVHAKVGGNILRGVSFGITRGNVINAIQSVGSDIYIEKYGEISGEIIFEPGLPLEGKPIIPSLYRISEEITRTIEAFNIFLAS